MIHPKDYEILDKVCKYSDCKFYQVINIKTGKKHIARISEFDINNFSSMQFFYNEIRILSQINHPSFLEFNGYSLTNFKQESKPVIINENAGNFILQDLIYNLLMFPRINLTLTQKLIIIYGIAAGMSYLHSHDIVHRNLDLNNIFVDENYFPKISGLNFAKEIPPNSNENVNLTNEFLYCRFFLPPETLQNQEYGKAGDVFTFSFIVLEIIGKEYPYQHLPDYKTPLFPKVDSQIPICYQNLIQKCSLIDPNKRPTFDEIIIELKTNQDFLRGVNKDEYFQYIKFMDDSQKSYESNEIFQSIEKNLHSLNLDRNKAYSKPRESSQSGVIYDLIH